MTEILQFRGVWMGAVRLRKCSSMLYSVLCIFALKQFFAGVAGRYKKVHVAGGARRRNGVQRTRLPRHRHLRGRPGHLGGAVTNSRRPRYVALPSRPTETEFVVEELMGEYKLPYELEAGHPSVAGRDARPGGRAEAASRHSSLRAHTRGRLALLVVVAHRLLQVGAVVYKAMEEMWEMEPDGRITAGCCLERMTSLAKATGAQRESLHNSLNQSSSQPPGDSADPNDPESSPLIKDYASPLRV